jgi:hypothetical protein
MLDTIFAGDITLVSILIMLATAIVMGILNSLIFSYKSYQTRNFSMALALVPLISSVIIFIVNDHLGVGVAVAGAFTLVRFRSVAGNGREIIAIFASMALGLILGMGYIGIAIIVFIVLALLTIILTSVNFGAQDNARTLTITIPDYLDYEGIFDSILRKYTKHYSLEKVRTKNMGSLFELTYTVYLKDLKKTKQFLDDIRVRNENLNVTLSSFGEHDSL